MAQPEITFLIINYNTIDLLRDCLASIKKQTAIAHHIVVIDNHSNDGSPEMVASEFPTVQLITNQQNTGFPTAVNQGLAVITTPYIFVLNSDIIFTEDTALTLKSFMDTHLQVGITGPSQVQPDGNQLLTTHAFPTLINEWGRNLFFTDMWRYRFQSKRYLEHLNQATKVDWIMGAALLIRKEMVEDIGGMDDKVFMYGEELDWAYRANKNNWDTVIVPEATVIHHKSASADQVFSVRRYAIVTKSEYYFFAKHHGFWQLPLFALARIIGSALRMFISGLLSIFGIQEARYQFLEHWYTIRLSLSPSIYQWIFSSLKVQEEN